jgi:hypothetical protein
MEEVIGFILEVLLDLIGDVVIQLLFETVGEAGAHLLGHLMGEPQRVRPEAAALGYLLLGGAAGGLSLFPFPSPLVHPSRLHGISLLVAPAVTGLVMHTLGTIRRRYGGALVRLDTFTYAFLFALGMALVRFQWAH